MGVLVLVVVGIDSIVLIACSSALGRIHEHPVAD